MKKQKNLIIIAMIIALALCTVLAGALADDRIYTSPAFSLPADSLLSWAEAQAAASAAEVEAAAAAAAEQEEAQQEPAAEPEAAPAEQPATEPEAQPVEQPAAEPETQPAVEPEMQPAEQPVAEPEAQPAEQPVTESETAPAEEPAPQQSAETEENTLEETETASEPEGPVERKVRIYSSQKDVVTEGEIITLTSALEGFDGLEITFQWQVDRGDGAGWVDVEGANRSKHSFIANRETIKYSWRLIVNVIE